jgi:hypothetical protein
MIDCPLKSSPRPGSMTTAVLSVQVEDCVDQIESETAHCYRLLSNKSMFPRNRVCAQWFSLQVCWLERQGPVGQVHFFVSSICVPSSVSSLGHAFGPTCCFALSNSAAMFRICPDHLFNHCNRLGSICIPWSVESIGIYCFGNCGSLSAVTFETDSQVSLTKLSAFSGAALQSICLPARLETIGQTCLNCRQLSVIEFETTSMPTTIEDRALSLGMVVREICLPARVRNLTGLARSLYI